MLTLAMTRMKLKASIGACDYVRLIFTGEIEKHACIKNAVLLR
jgi:hypothetical protein